MHDAIELVLISSTVRFSVYDNQKVKRAIDFELGRRAA